MKKYIAAMAVWALVAPSTWAQLMVAQHFGTSDPLTEGWTLGAASDGSLGSPIIDSGVGAWNVNDSSTVFRLNYQTNNLTPTPLQSNLFNSAGWHLSWKVNLITTNIQPDLLGAVVSLGLQDIIPGAPRYRIFLGRNATNLLIQVRDNAGDGGNKNFTIAGQATGFHTFDVFGDANSANARLYVDGALLTNWNGEADTEKHLHWGSFEQSTVAESHWAYIYLEVPEPSALAMLAFAGCGLLLRRKRK